MVNAIPIPKSDNPEHREWTLSSDSTRSEVVARLSHKFIYIDAKAHHNGFYFLSIISHLRDSLVSSPGTSTQTHHLLSIFSSSPHANTTSPPPASPCSTYRTCPPLASCVGCSGVITPHFPSYLCTVQPQPPPSYRNSRSKNRRSSYSPH
jgi:hypothetical protein